MFISRHIAILLRTVDVINVRDLCTIRYNSQIRDDLILTLRSLYIRFLELTLGHGAHLHCCDLMGHPRVHVEVLIEVLIRREEGVQIPTQNNMDIR